MRTRPQPPVGGKPLVGICWPRPPARGIPVGRRPLGASPTGAAPPAPRRRGAGKAAVSDIPAYLRAIREEHALRIGAAPPRDAPRTPSHPGGGDARRARSARPGARPPRHRGSLLPPGARHRAARGREPGAAGREERKNVVLATPTASGKTLVYNLPVLRRALADPEARALYIFPLKALERDQRQRLEETRPPWASPGARMRVAIYDGDTPPARGASCGTPPRTCSSPRPTCCTPASCPTTPAGGASSENLRHRRDRRAPHLPRHLRRPRGPGAAAARTGRALSRRPAAARRRVGDDREPGRAGVGAHRPRVRGRPGRRRAAIAAPRAALQARGVRPTPWRRSSSGSPSAWACAPSPSPRPA